jgi:protein TonB
VTANKASAKANAPQAILIKNGSSQPVAANNSATDAPAPSINAIASDSGSSMPNLMGGANKAPAPVLQTVTISQGISQGLLVKKTQPAYPASALRMGIQGPVQLLATVSKTGDISAVKILSGDASLARAASDAVKQWKYKPYLLDGSPVEIQTQVTVNFKLPPR